MISIILIEKSIITRQKLFLLIIWFAVLFEFLILMLYYISLGLLLGSILTDGKWHN